MKRLGFNSIVIGKITKKDYEISSQNYLKRNYKYVAYMMLVVGYL